MAITDRTRKILWARSGNLCAICRRNLVEDKTEVSGESVVGDEAHIIGERPTAARGELGIGRNDLDEYKNLILLCKVHHKLIDDQPETYPVDRLNDIKAHHEAWVKQALSKRSSEVEPHFSMLIRMKTGKEIAAFIADALAFILDHDELETQEEVDLVGGFLESVQDWGDIWRDLDSGQHVEAKFSLAKQIKEIEAAGFFVFATIENRTVYGGNKAFEMPTAIIVVVRSTNSSIQSNHLPSIITK